MLGKPSELESGAAILFAVSISLTSGLAYYSFRTIALFKGSVAARAWIYVALSAVFLSVGLITFLIDTIAPLGLFVFAGILMMVGGMFLFLGLRKNFLFWASKDHFT